MMWTLAAGLQRESFGCRLEDAEIEPARARGVTDETRTLCVECPSCGAANALQLGGTNRLQASPVDADLQRVSQLWDTLPEPILAAILALIDSQPRPGNSGGDEPPTRVL